MGDPMDKSEYYNCINPLMEALDEAKNEQDTSRILMFINHSHSEFERVFPASFWPNRDNRFRETKEKIKQSDPDEYEKIVDNLVEDAFRKTEDVDITPF